MPTATPLGPWDGATHVDRLTVGNTFRFLTQAGAISGEVVYVLVDSGGHLHTVQLADGRVLCGPAVITYESSDGRILSNCPAAV